MSTETIKIPIMPGMARGAALHINAETNARLQELAQKTNITPSGLGDYLLNIAMDHVEIIIPNEVKA